MKRKTTRRRTERRNKPRADARLSMRVEGVTDGESGQIVTESQNISASGVYCTSSHYLAPFSKVGLTIVLPRLPGGRAAKELIKCEGIVVRCQPTAKKSERHFELACAFSGLDEKRRGMLDDFVAWRNLQALHAATREVNGPGRLTRGRAGAARRSGAGVSASRRKSVTRGRAIH